MTLKCCRRLGQLRYKRARLHYPVLKFPTKRLKKVRVPVHRPITSIVTFRTRRARVLGSVSPVSHARRSCHTLRPQTCCQSHSQSYRLHIKPVNHYSGFQTNVQEAQLRLITNCPVASTGSKTRPSRSLPPHRSDRLPSHSECSETCTSASPNPQKVCCCNKSVPWAFLPQPRRRYFARSPCE
jgi:hypothetical protein